MKSHVVDLTASCLWRSGPRPAASSPLLAWYAVPRPAARAFGGEPDKQIQSARHIRGAYFGQLRRVDSWTHVSYEHYQCASSLFFKKHHSCTESFRSATQTVMKTLCLPKPSVMLLPTMESWLQVNVCYVATNDAILKHNAILQSKRKYLRLLRPAMSAPLPPQSLRLSRKKMKGNLWWRKKSSSVQEAGQRAARTRRQGRRATLAQRAGNRREMLL